MNRAGKTIMTVMLAAACALPAYAQNADPGPAQDDAAWAGQQGGAPPAMRREEVRKKIQAIRMWRLTEELKLDEATSARLASIMSSLDQQRQDMRHQQREMLRELRLLLNAAKPDEAKLKTALDRIEHTHGVIQQLKDRELSSAREVLTIEQQARFVLFQAEFMRDMRRMISNARRDMPGPDRGMGQGKGRLPASDEQR